MPRFYVKNKENKWNIYSTIVDDLLFDDFVDFEKMKSSVIQETIEKRNEELNTLLTTKPELNVMSYEEMLEKLKFYNKKKYNKLKGENKDENTNE